MMSSTTAETRLAPYIGRLRVVTLARVVVVLVTVVLAPALSELHGDGEVRATIGAASAVYAVLSLVALLGVRWRPQSTARVLELTLAADAAWVVAVLWPTGGVYSPLLFLFHLQLISITVLFGWRAALRMAIYQTVGFLWLVTEQGAGGPNPTAVGGVEVAADAGTAGVVHTAALVQAIFNLVAIWVVLGVTAYFSSVNEAGLRRSVRELAVLRKLGTQLERSHELTDVSQAIAQGVVRELGYRRAVVWTHRRASQLVATGTDGFEQDELDGLEELVLSANDGAVGRAVDRRQVQLIARGESRPSTLATTFGPEASIVLVPLAVEGRLLGVLTVELARPVAGSLGGTGRDLHILGTLATEASLALDNARLHADLRDLATTDALTGVYNHRYFQQRLQEELDRSMRRASVGAMMPVSLILMDIDHFKSVNDTYGHLTGDELLRALARLTGRVLRSSDVVCRYGGEEFGVILPETDRTQASQVAERLREAIERSSFTSADGGALGRVTASFGVATVSDSLPSRDALIAKADSAMYAAKRSGRNRVVNHVDGDTSEFSVGRIRALRAVQHRSDHHAGSA